MNSGSNSSDSNSCFYMCTIATPKSPQVLHASAICIDMSGQVILNWTSPNNTILGVENEYYLLNVTRFTCSPDQCNVTAASTTITGLQCNTNYNVTVKAVNCFGEGAPSEWIMINSKC